MNRCVLFPGNHHIVTPVKAKRLFLHTLVASKDETIKRSTATAGQSITEFIIIFPVLLLMMYCVVFFARLLVLKQRCITATRYVAWHAGRNEGEDPSTGAIKTLFFENDTNISVKHPSPIIGFAGNTLGDLGNVLGSVSGIDGTELDVEGGRYPLVKLKLKTKAQHFVFLDTWKSDGTTGRALKYALWAIAVAKGFQGSSINIDLETPSIP
jgi:hypothetical protein